MKLLFQGSGPKTVQKVYRNDINKFLEKILAAISQCSDPEFCLGCNDDENTQHVIDTLKLNILLGCNSPNLFSNIHNDLFRIHTKI